MRRWLLKIALVGYLLSVGCWFVTFAVLTSDEGVTADTLATSAVAALLWPAFLLYAIVYGP